MEINIGESILIFAASLIATVAIVHSPSMTVLKSIDYLDKKTEKILIFIFRLIEILFTLTQLIMVVYNIFIEVWYKLQPIILLSQILLTFILALIFFLIFEILGIKKEIIDKE